MIKKKVQCKNWAETQCAEINKKTVTWLLVYLKIFKTINQFK